jgi:hypothetical protein
MHDGANVERTTAPPMRALARVCSVTVALGLAVLLAAPAALADSPSTNPGSGVPAASPPPSPATPGTAADLWNQASLATTQGRSIAAGARDGALALKTGRSQLGANVRLLRAIIRQVESALSSAPDQASADILDPDGRIHQELQNEYAGMVTVHASLAEADRGLEQTAGRLIDLTQSLRSLEAGATRGARVGGAEGRSFTSLVQRLRPWLRWTATEWAYVDRLRQEVALRWSQFDAVRRALGGVWDQLPSSLQSGLDPAVPAATPSASTGAASVTYSNTGCVQSIHSSVRIPDASIATYAASAGFRGSDLAVAVAVALAESGGDPRAVCVDANGSRDEGLWQINSVHGYPSSCTFDPSCSAAVAYRLYLGRGRSFGDWVTYSSDRFLSYLSRGEKAAAAVQPRT